MVETPTSNQFFDILTQNKPFILKLTFATTIAWTIDFTLLFVGFMGASFLTVFDHDVGVPIYETIQIYVIFGAIVGGTSGLLVGSSQWFVLRYRLDRDKMRILSTLIGCIIGWGIVFGWIAFNNRFYASNPGKQVNMLNYLLILVLGEIIIGSSQWYYIDNAPKQSGG